MADPTFKTYCTEIYYNGKTYCGQVEAQSWKEAEQQCAQNEKVVGELVEEILFGAN